MVDTIKFSEMTDGGDLAPNEKTPGLLAGANVLFNNPFPLLPPGTTAERPAIAPSMYYRLRFNTSLESYEYYTPVDATWYQLNDSGDISTILALLASHMAGEGASLIGLQDQGGVVSKTVQDFANATLIAQTDNGSLANAQFLNALPTGFVSVTTVTGVLNSRVMAPTANQIDIANPSGAAGNPTFSLSATLSAPGTFTVQGTTAVDSIINDNTLATATATNLATALAIKTYVDAQVGGSVASVSGTLNRITSTGGANPIIDISASYVGQASITTLGTITTGVWNGTLISPQFGGSGVNNGASTFTIGGNTSFVGAFTFAGTLTSNTAVTFPTSGTLATTGQLPTPAALTKTDDTNVTLTLGGTPATALLQATSLTLGWTGQLSLTRGGSNASLTASNGGIIYSTATAMAVLAGTATAGQILRSGATAAPSWSTSTYPATNAINTLLYASSANVMSALATANNGVLVTDSGGIPSISSTLPAAVLTNIPGRLKSFQIFTSGTAATYTRPAGITSILVEVVGGGGGGGGILGAASSASGAGGGGSGGYARLWVAAAASSYTYTVGAGGAGGVAGNNAGSTGGTTTFSASSLQATGGVGGTGSAAIPAAGSSINLGGAAGVGSNGDINSQGTGGFFGGSVNGNILPGSSGSSLYGGGAKGISAAGGNYGGGGGGAGGTTVSVAGGAGSAGIIIVWEYS